MTTSSWGLGDRRRLCTADVPASVLALVDERQGGRFCVWCRAAGREPPPDEPLELDHKQPLSRGGDNHHLNLQWACRACNRGRGARREPPKAPTWAR